MRTHITALFCSAAALFCFSVRASAEYSGPLSSSSFQVPATAFPSSGYPDAPGSLRGVIPPRGLRARDWSAQLIVWNDAPGGLPAFALGSGKDKNSLRLMYGDSALPHIKDEGAFLRGSGVDVKRNVTLVRIDADTVAYTSDAVNAFRTRTRALTLYFDRVLYGGESAQISVSAGAGVIYRFYSVDCALADDSAFTERASSYGFLLSPGIKVGFGAASAIKRGFEVSFYLVYDRIWLHAGGKKLARPLAEELEGLRLGFGLGWRFNFYE